MRVLQGCDRDYPVSVGFNVENVTWSLPIVRNCTEELEFDRFLEILDAAIIVPFLAREARDVVDLILDP